MYAKSNNDVTVDAAFRSFVQLCFAVTMYARHVLRRLGTTICHEDDLYTLATHLIGSNSVDKSIPDSLFDHNVITATRIDKNKCYIEGINNYNNIINISSYCYSKNSRQNTDVESKHEYLIDCENSIIDK